MHFFKFSFQEIHFSNKFWELQLFSIVNFEQYQIKDHTQGLNWSSQMLYSVIFPTEINLPIRPRYDFLFYIFLSYLKLLWYLTLLLCQSNLCIVLAHGKSPTNSIHKDLFKTKTPKQKPHWFPATFYMP